MDDLSPIAEAIINSPFKKFAVYGMMGAGKTTLIKMICAKLGVQENTSSPTFAIVNEYSGEEKIYHFDLFRINSYVELNEIGFTEYLESENYIFIEWPEVAEPLLDLYDFKKIKISIGNYNERMVNLET